MNDIALKIQNLTLSYGKACVVEDINLGIKKGEVLAIVGESGCGKSSLLKSILGIDKNLQIKQGKIDLYGTNLLSLTKEERRRVLGKRIAIVPQNPTSSFNPLRKFKKQFMETFKSHSIPYDEARVIEVMQSLGLKDAGRILNSYPYNMSGGMNQRIAISLAILLEPEILLCDEATSALDLRSQKQVIDELIKLNQNLGISILFVTHNLGVAKAISHHLGIIRNGSMVEYGKTEDILANPTSEYARSLISDVPSIRHCMCKKNPDMDYFYYKNEQEDILNILHATKTYHDIKALNSISLLLKEGEILGIVGESGSGKSTLLRQISGLEHLDKGTIYLNEEEITHKRPQYICKYLQMVFQDPIASFDPHLKIGDALTETIEHFAGSDASKSVLEENLKEILEEVELDIDLLQRYPRELSGGQCQRFAIARTILSGPKILLCDEATSALDVSSQKQVLEVLWKLKKRYDISIIFVSHDLALVSNFCDRIIVLKDGQIVEEGYSHDIIHKPQQEYTKDLLSCVYEIR